AHVPGEAAALECGESLLPAHAHQEGLETCRTLSFRAAPHRSRPAQDRAGRARVGERRFLASDLRGPNRLCNRLAGPNEVWAVFALSRRSVRDRVRRADARGADRLVDVPDAVDLADDC